MALRLTQSEPTLLPGAHSAAAKWFMREVMRKSRLAHHPTCPRYDHHLLRVKSVSLCLGCTCVASGMGITIATLLLFIAVDYRGVTAIGPWSCVLAGLLGYLPTLAQVLFQNKTFKIVSRTMLGAAVVSLWFGAMCLLPFSWTGLGLRIIFVAVFRFVYKATQELRARRSKLPCDGCPRGVFPFCQAYRERNERLLVELSRLAIDKDEAFVRFAQSLIRGGDSECEISVEPINRSAPPIVSL